LTAVKKAEKRNSLIVRGFNHTANKVVLPPLANESTVYFTNVLEQRKSKYSANACTVDSHKIFTVEATRRH
jgi:alpha-mannosidase